MREWMRCDQFEMGAICGMLALVAVLIAGAYETAHAQKPAQQPKQELWIHGPDGKDVLGPWIEQHCVAVLTEKHTVHHKLTATAPSFDDRMEWDDEVPEQVLKLRCTPDKEQK